MNTQNVPLEVQIIVRQHVQQKLYQLCDFLRTCEPGEVLKQCVLLAAQIRRAILKGDRVYFTPEGRERVRLDIGDGIQEPEVSKHFLVMHEEDRHKLDRLRSRMPTPVLTVEMTEREYCEYLRLATHESRDAAVAHAVELTHNVIEAILRQERVEITLRGRDPDLSVVADTGEVRESPMNARQLAWLA